MSAPSAGEWLVAERDQAEPFGTAVDASRVTAFGVRGMFADSAGNGILVELVKPANLAAWREKRFATAQVSLEVILMNGEALPELSVPLHSSVAQVKAAIEEASGIQEKAQKLMAGEEVLQDAQILNTLPAFQCSGKVALSLIKLAPELELRVLTMGFDAAGKTTILYKLKLDEVVTTIPTVGFNVETIDYKNMHICMWDAGGADRVRPLWRHYYQNTDALIFVVDSNDHDRIDAAQEELTRLLNEDELRDCALLVFANKQDLPNAMPVSEVTERLRLHTVRNRRWYIQAACATAGHGLFEGMDWLHNTFTQRALHR